MFVQGLNHTTYSAMASSQSTALRQDAPSSAATIADTITISDAARTLAASSSPAEEAPSLRYRRIMLADAKADPDLAKKAAREYANDRSHELHGPLVDIRDYPTIRFSATGEVVTEESLAAFKTEAAKAREGRMALYQAEKAKGTPDAEILEKLFAYTDTLSDSYLSKINWTRPGLAA